MDKIKVVNSWILIICLLLINVGVHAQTDSTKVTHNPSKEHEDKIRLLTYIRFISNANGSVRMDQNIVPNFRLNNWLRLEAGFRYGERPSYINSYYHYKVELQTKTFWRTTNLIARISDDVIKTPSPQYRKTNELFAIETTIPIGSSFRGFIGGGYVLSSQQYNKAEPLPTNKGVQNNYPIFKLAARYLFKDRQSNKKGFIEGIYGSYDVFNPYELNRPFVQETTEYELSHACSLFSYFRYQFNKSLGTPYNYFLGLGTIFHIGS